MDMTNKKEIGEIVRSEIDLAQDGDSIINEDQYLKITVEDAGGGKYLSISTSRWSLDPDDIDAFAARLKELFERLK
jgi:hypothetical protein